MPLNRPPLGEAEIRLIRDWIDAGAAGPVRRTTRRASRGRRTGPSSRPGARSRPRSDDRGWVRNPDRPVHPGPARAGRALPVAARPTRPRCFAGPASTWSACPRRPRRSRPSWPIDGPIVTKRAVDRLLASPHFGERWARPWLDLARYADSNGYSIDAPRSIWKYRDWVIAAFNDDMPFDHFVDRPDRRRPAAGRHDRPADRHRVPPQHADQPGGRDRPRAVPDRVDRGPGQHDGDGLPRPDDRLLPVPRPQVRPDQPARVLPAVRLLQQRGRARPGDRHAGGAWPGAARSQERIDRFHRDLVARTRTSRNASDGGKSRCRRPTSRTRRSTPSWRSTCRASNGRRPSTACSSSCLIGGDPAFSAERRRSRSCGRPSRKSSPRWSSRERIGPPRPTFVLLGGDFTRRGEPVDPAVPTVLPPLDGVSPGNRPDRMDLARWLVDRAATR